jgi:hypothetical protein
MITLIGQVVDLDPKIDLPTECACPETLLERLRFAARLRSRSDDDGGHRSPAKVVAPLYLALAFFRSARILASSAVLNPFSAKEVGHMAPSSRFALSLKRAFTLAIGGSF